MKTSLKSTATGLIGSLLLAGSASAASVTATDGGTAVYGACNGMAIDFDATVAPNAVWTPGLAGGEIYKLNSVAIKNASGNTGTYYLGVYAGFSGGVLSGIQGVSDNANNFANSPNNWLTFTFSNLNQNITVDLTVGSGSGMRYFAYQSGASALTSPNVTLGTDKFGADTYMSSSLASIIAYGGVVANRSPQYQATITPGLSTCYVDVASTFQTMDGFGFSDGWSGTLSSAKNHALYQTLGFSIFRAFISTNRSGYVTPVQNITAARAAGAKVFATAWPATSWNNATGATNHLDPAHYADYANWLHDTAASLGLDYVSPMNEPDFGVEKWTPTEILNFIKSNAPAIGKPVMMPESFHFDDNYSDPVLNDPVAVNNVAIVAGHFYGGGNSVHQNAINHGKRVWETEHTVDNGLANAQNDITNCMALAKEVSDAMNNQFSAYCWWWVNDGATETDLVLGDGTIFKSGYILGQFARWVRPGMVHCGTTYNPAAGVFVTAYHDSTNGIVIVALNGTSSVNQAFTVQNATNVNRFGVRRTSASESMTSLPGVSVTNNTFSYTLPAQSVTTFVQFFGGIPSAPASLNVTVASSGQNSLHWNTVTNATGYNVKHSTTNGGPYATVASWVTGTNYTDTVYYTGATYNYVVSAINDGGESGDSPQGSATTPGSLNIEPIADSYVQDGSLTNSNFGAAASLIVKNDGGTNTGYNRITFFKFDVHALANARSAELILTPAQVDGNIPLAYEFATNNTWSETGITWNNQPGGSGIFFTNMSGYVLNVPMTIDFTATVASQATNGGYLSLRVMDTNARNTRIDFYSKEASNSSYHPVLRVSNPMNTPPVLAAISNRTVGAGVTLNITNVANDSDVPAQTLTFSLLAAPTNATINSGSGVLTWRPLTTQANSTNPFTVMVADNGTPEMTTTRSFAVTVTNLSKPVLSSPFFSANQLVLQINGASGPDYQIQASTNLVNWSKLFTTNSPTVPFTWTNNLTDGPPMNFFRVLVGPPLP